MLIRIITEDKERKQVLAIIWRYFDSFTYYTGFGVWKRKEEQILIVEIDSTTEAGYNYLLRIKCVVEEINRISNQTCCLVQEIQTTSKLM